MGDAKTATDELEGLFSLFLQHFVELAADNPLPTDAIAEKLSLKKSQVNAWLKRGVADGYVKKLNRPVRYQPDSDAGQQASLFED